MPDPIRRSAEHDEVVMHRLEKVEEEAHEARKKSEEDGKAIRLRLHDLSGSVQANALENRLTQEKINSQNEHLLRQDASLKEIKDGVKHLTTLLVGDGTPNNCGVVPRVTAVERTLAGWIKVVWILLGGLVALLGNLVYSWVKTK